METLDESQSGAFLRGLLLKEQGRYQDAERFFREALGENPRNAQAFHHLAGCLFQIDGKEAQALAPAEEAIALEPQEPAFHALRAHILCFLDRPKEGLAAARTAMELDPDDPYSFVAETQSLSCLERWPEAEQSARRALELDPENLIAANLLARALRLQNKMEENREQLEGMLARDPENAFTHASAGWSALQAGDRQKAEAHFLESLRLNPESEAAREGLLHSFRARSPFYRAYLKYSFLMARLSGKARWAVILGLYFGVKFARGLFHGAYAPIGYGIALLYAVVVFWVWLARPLGNLILVFDRFARHALRRPERWEALCVGGSLAAAVAMVAVAFLTGWVPPLLSAVAFCAATIPLSLIFTNGSRPGRVLFGAVAVYLVGLGILSPWASGGMLILGVLAAAASTWLGNASFFRKG